MNLVDTIASVRRSAARAQESVLPTESIDASPYVRFAFVFAVLVMLVGMTVWTSMTMRHRSVALSKARDRLEAAQIEHQRLLVERALLRDPGRLGTLAEGMGLVSPTAVVDMRFDGGAE
jgi:cell division protein FtsL